MCDVRRERAVYICARRGDHRLRVQMKLSLGIRAQLWVSQRETCYLEPSLSGLHLIVTNSEKE